MQRVVSAIILSSLAFSALAACKKEAASDLTAEANAIRAVEDQMRAAYKAKDAAKLVAAYAPDATLYVTSDRARVGTDAMTKGATKDMADPAFNVTFTTAKAQVAASGDMGYTQGSFVIRYTNPATKMPTSYSGYYLTVFRKQADGSWKATEDISTPAA
jgi:uncharacterized protein (TIGR02246 family)